jgi:ubiquinone/menaquinone biosynthesis C-methylase UbiE
MYANSEEASTFLVEGKPGCMLPMAKVMFAGMQMWSQLPEAVRSGVPAAPATLEQPDNPFWTQLVPAIAPLARLAASVAIQRLEIAKAGPIAILDVGGGSGMFAIEMLKTNPQAAATQLDWPNVNRIARGYAEQAGVAARFHTIDGDFHTLDFGERSYDIGIYGAIAHQESLDANIAILRKLRRALRPKGALALTEFMLDDDRQGSTEAALFHGQMLLSTHGGAVYTEGQLRRCLAEAGFTDVSVCATPIPSTSLLLAR